jgi:hypothetical protein
MTKVGFWSGEESAKICFISYRRCCYVEVRGVMV